MKRDLYAEVSARIIAELEAGAAPCVKPWSANPGANTPCNAVNNRPYSECDVVLLWMAQATLDARTLGEQNVASVCQEWDMDEPTYDATASESLVFTSIS